LLLFACVVAVMLLVAAFAAAQRKSRDNGERARLFEMGYYLPRRPSRWPQAFFCTALGLGVPIVTLALTAFDRSGPWTDHWIVACVISCTAIVGATIVAGVVFSRPEPSGQPEKLAPNAVKPVLDPDALDFAGRLGRG
jgi:hypothetical protein